ncbi:hypothetical protein SAMD00023353_6800030 [Rosellinia necatrix]|uniref:Uncharacterized protein n=1 Tax=Rosellinia necatrix TaxID=77044 RepID=A0A1S8AAF2_ROSNE|nr:hypothetical protein SAMD00023353_6800030 [Rosellinia necatrix]
MERLYIRGYAAPLAEKAPILPRFPRGKSDRINNDRVPNDEIYRSDDSLPTTLAPIGKPAIKELFSKQGICALSISLISLAIGLAAVLDENLSWYLGVQNGQLIILGLLLSVMNLCLGTVTPTFFLVIEARFGPSTLQNYDGLLRNKITGSNFSNVWRFVSVMMMAIPIVLGIAYKSFSGGESQRLVDSTAYTGATPLYGMFAPPNIQSGREQTGIPIFANATSPFKLASSPTNGSEPPLPTFPEAFGHNVLLLNSKSAALLDIPHPSYVSAIQNLLDVGESWELHASVLGTVSKLNDSRSINPIAYNSTLIQVCEDALNGSGAYTWGNFLTRNTSLLLIYQPNPGDQSYHYLGFSNYPVTEVSGSEVTQICADFSHVAERYDLTRQQCEGIWSITRGGMELTGGSCDETVLPFPQQSPLTNVSLFVGFCYLPNLVDLLAPFTASRANSPWTIPYVATGVGAMVWSRVMALYGAMSQGQSSDPTTMAPLVDTNFTFEEVGLVYRVDDRAIYARPTLMKSPLLCAVLAITPLLVAVALGLTAVFHSTPLGNGFGMVSILSGMDHRSLSYLAGASLSGDLAKDVRLVIHPYQDSKGGSIEYCLESPSKRSARNGRLLKRVKYH